MAAAANNDGVNVQPVKKQEIVELDYGACTLDDASLCLFVFIADCRAHGM